MERKLATIRTIKSVEDIPNADSIVKLRFESMGWVCVTNKETNPQVGDRRVYFEVDSVLPNIPIFDFMVASNFVVRTMKFRGQVSQGLSMPLSDFPELNDRDFPVPEWGKTGSIEILPDGFDLTNILGVKKFEFDEDKMDEGTKGPFPGFIQKTSEERAEDISNLEELLQAHEWDGTVKLDGKSGTFYLYNGEFGVCSHRVELKDLEESIYWQMARKYNIEKRMRALTSLKNFAIQGEIVGPGVCKNRLGLTELRLYLFTIQDIDLFLRYSNTQVFTVSSIMSKFADGTPFEMVPTIPVSSLKTFEDVVALSEGSCIITDRKREGVILRAKDDPAVSIKYVNPNYLLKHGI
jgi:RNA ligase (TIGR02306 family)